MQVALYQKGAAQPGLNLEHLVAFRLPLPPIEEQLAISSYLSSAITKLDTLISEAETAIGLLQERRSALISAAVTGKIDVRGEVPDTTEAA
jgi:Restriction endonuclease S subunits